MTADDEQRLKELLRQWQNHALAPHLREELFHLLARPDLNGPLTAEMQKIWEATDSTKIFDSVQKEAMLASITHHRQPGRFRIRYAVAAAALVAVMATAILLTHQPPKPVTGAKKESSPPVQLADVVAPAANKAILTLADGSRIVLQNSGNGNLTTQGNIKVVKSGNDQLVYKGIATEVNWNTLTVPKGSKPIHLTLTDGSRVTLNVASSLTYPTSFSGSDRHVTLTGEAFFDVAKMPAGNGSGNVPFIVSANGTAVEVTGTKFNVNGYDDEAGTKTTLVEGTVNIVAGDQRQALVPSQQAVVEKEQAYKIKLNKKADVEEATAWLNGRFRFNGADIETVMRQVVRWYDIEVKFAARPKMRFGGQIDRNSTLLQVFKILEKSGLHFSLDGKVVTVLP